ncbi:hypothetical protein PJP12_29815, partial [Mycobacterium kansasii]
VKTIRPNLVEAVIDQRGRGKGLAQTTLENRYKQKDRKITIQYIAKWFYQTGITFNVVKSRSFKVMVEAIGQFEHGLKPPPYHEMRET